MHLRKCNYPSMKIQILKKILFSFLLTISFNTAHAQNFSSFFNGLKDKINEVAKENTFKELQEIDNSLLSLKGRVAPNVKWMMISIVKNNFLDQIVFPIKDGYYETRLPLQDGAGVYDIILYANSNIDRNASYTQVKKISVENTDTNDMSFLLPTSKVQSDDDRIINLVKNLTINAQNDEEAFLSIYQYVTSTIKYDYAGLNDPTLRMDYNAINTLVYSKAVCEGYANLLAAMSRAYGIRTKVIIGTAINSAGSTLHAWNEVFLHDEWKFVDATWDAQFSSQPYLFMNAKAFATDHFKEIETKY